MKKGLLSIFFSSLIGFVNAQQIGQSSLSMFNKLGQNPAVAGLDPSLEVQLGYRAQWLGLEGAPQMQYLNATMPIPVISSGVGLVVDNQQIAAQKATRLMLSYSYIQRLGSDMRLSFGVSGGVLQGGVDGTKLRTPNGDYNQGIINHQDRSLDILSIQGVTPTADIGIYLSHSIFETGISVQNVLQPHLKLNGQNMQRIWLKRHFFGYLGTNIVLFGKLSAHPSVSLRTDGKEAQIDFSTFFRFNNNFFLGAAFRGYNTTTQEALVFMGGMRLNAKINLVYAYDYSLSPIRTAQTGSHEILLKYNLGKEFGRGKMPPIIYTPRL